MGDCPTLPEGFVIGPLSIKFYGILIMIGVLAATWITIRELKRRGIGSEEVWNGLPWVVIAGILGARLWHVFTPTPADIASGITTGYYLSHPLDILSIWKGGLGIPGAVIGGGVALLIYSRIIKKDYRVYIDCVAPGLLLAQAIGRWGNFFNQELYGAPTDLPWGLPIEWCRRLAGYEQFERFHPLFFYEFLWNILGVIVLLWLARKLANWIKVGDIFLMYLIWYPVGRFFLEFLRLNSAQIGGINFNQTFMAVIAVLAAGLLIWRHKFPRKTTPVVAVAIAGEDTKEKDETPKP
jgi:phosphatidylglycerol:prolipoprotein diacylglycerol transferase